MPFDIRTLFRFSPGEVAALHVKLDLILAQLRRGARTMSEITEVLARLKQEVADSRGVTESAITYIKGVPEVVRKAVEAALAANPGVDLGALTGLADDLDAQQAELVAALTANPETPPATAPETPPAEGGTL